MDKLREIMEKLIAEGKGPDTWPLVDPLSYSRSTRQTKMLVHNAIRKCIKVNESVHNQKKQKSEQSEKAAFICFECERIIAYLDLRGIPGDAKSLTLDIMTAAQQEDFKCHLCGSTTYGLTKINK